MSLFQWLRRSKSSLPTIEHPVFGTLEATIENDDGTFFWETPRSVATAKGSIGVFFDAPQDGPTNAQVALWQWVYDNAENLAKAAQPLIRARLQDLRLDHHISSLIWSAVGLSRDGERTGPWDMSFELSSHDNAVLTAYFVDGVPHTVSFDD